MTEKPSENTEMSEVAWVSEQLRARVAPPAFSSSIGERIRYASRRLGWKHSRTKDYWYADDRIDPKPGEMRRVEELTGQHYGREERREVDSLIAKADALLEGGDPDFYRPFVDAFRALLGAVDRS